MKPPGRSQRPPERFDTVRELFVPDGPIELSFRLDAAGEFGRVAPLELEIGAGMGGFALDHAQAHPEIDLCAFEIKRSLAALIDERRVRRKIPNLRVFGADARMVLPRMFAPRTLSVVHIQFPDPWWKTRHHARRIVDDDVSIVLYRLLRLDGLLELRTDVKDRGEEMCAVLEAVGFVNRFGPGTCKPYDPTEVASTRERGYLARGEPVFRYEFGVSEAPPRRLQKVPTSKVGLAARKR